MFVNDRDEMSNLYRGPSIDASYQVSVHLAKRFQRRRFLKSANQKQELPVVAMFVNGSGQNVQSLERTFHRCFLPSFSSFGWGVSEEKIKMWKVNGRQVMAKAHIGLQKLSVGKKTYLHDLQHIKLSKKMMSSKTSSEISDNTWKMGIKKWKRKYLSSAELYKICILILS